MYKLEDVYKTFPSGATEDYKILRAFEMGKQEGGAKVKELEAQNEKLLSLNEEIIKSLKESFDYAWLPAHNGKAKFIYLQTVIDIVNEKFEGAK